MQRLGKMRQAETWRENVISEQIHWNKEPLVKQNARQDETSAKWGNQRLEEETIFEKKSIKFILFD